LRCSMMNERMGTSRLTADVDAMLLLSIEDLPRLMEAAAQEGLVPRITAARDICLPGQRMRNG